MESGKDISVVAKGGARRCAFCHGGLGEGWEAHCARGSTVHLGCLTEAGDSCPTCGAPTGAPDHADVLRKQVDALGPLMAPRAAEELYGRIEGAIHRLIHHGLERQSERVTESNARLLKALVFAFVLLAAVLSGAFGLLRS